MPWMQLVGEKRKGDKPRAFGLRLQEIEIEFELPGCYEDLFIKINIEYFSCNDLLACFTVLKYLDTQYLIFSLFSCFW